MIKVKLFDIECLRPDQIRSERFDKDVELINKFIEIQKESNPDFLVEIMIEPNNFEPHQENTMLAAVNFVVHQSDGYKIEENHGVSDVLSLSTTLLMTGYCKTNNKAQPNSVLYRNVALNNRLGMWGYHQKAIDELWWATPEQWDKLNPDVKEQFWKNYRKFNTINKKNISESNER